MAEDRRRVLTEVAAQARAYLAFERQMATPGIPSVVPRWPDDAGQGADAADQGASAAEQKASAAEQKASAAGHAGTPVGAEAEREDTASPAWHGPSETPRAASAPPDVSAFAPAHALPQEASPPEGVPRDERVRRLKVLAEQAAGCTDCVLHEQRHRNVFARGNPASDIVFVGEGPGRDEDQQGLPFVGAAGQLLDKMVAAMGYGRDDVYICNVVKCRPPQNRTPRPDEALACARFLRPQLSLVQPQVIVALGRCAAEHLGAAPPEGSWRGRWGQYEGIRVMPTYHPAFLLRSPQFKRVVWQDLQKVLAELGRPVPKRR